MADKPTATPTPMRDTSSPGQVQAQAIRDSTAAFAARKMAVDDAGRAQLPKVQMIALAGFTLVADDAPEGRVIAAGQEFETSEYDVKRIEGRARRKLLDATAIGGSF